MKVWLIQDGEVLPYINKGAREMRCATLATALVRDGAEVLWWASTFDHASKKQLYQESTTVSPIPGLTIRLLHGPGYSHNQSLARIVHQKSLARSFAQETLCFPLPDVIVANIPYPELAAEAVSFGKRFGVPVIVYVEDAWPDIYLTMAPKCLHKVLRLVFAFEFNRIKIVFKSAAAIFAVSNAYLNWALRYAGRERIAVDDVFPLGYPPPKTRTIPKRSELWDMYGVDSSRVVISFAGVFGYSYDLGTVIKAARLLAETGENRVHFVLIGDGDCAKSLRESAAGLHNITFLGWLGHQALYDILTCSDIGLAAYHVRATQTLPYKPFEYMAAGLPLLSSLEGELNDLILRENIGATYKACDVKSLVEAIRNLISSPEQLSEMRKRSRELFHARFSTDVICPKVVSQIKDIASRGVKDYV